MGPAGDSTEQRAPAGDPSVGALPTISSRITVALHATRLPIVLAAVSCLLLLPALGGGFQLDDHFHRMRLLGYGEPSIQLFVFYDGDPTRVRQGMEQGWLPWWSAENLRHASLRYLSVLTMQLDYLLWPHQPALMHLHSLLWLGALIAAATLLYRRIMGPSWVAGLAALLYAVDDAHAAPASYLANRNALIATCFGVLCLLCFARLRREGWRAGAVLGPLCLALALAAGEIALAAAGYLLSYALFLDRAPWRARLRSLTPNAAVLLVWAAVYELGGFGSEGSGLYLDPSEGALAFAGALLRRAPYLLLGQWTPIPADLFYIATADPALHAGLLLLAALVLLLLLALVGPLIRRDPIARFWALGALLSMAPIAATGPENRLLFFVGIGSMALLAQAVEALAARSPALPLRGVARTGALALVGLLLVAHLVVAPLFGVARVRAQKRAGETMKAALASVPDDAAIASQDLIVVNPPEHIYLVTAIPVVKALAGAATPRRMRTLAHGGAAMTIARLDERTLRVELDPSLFPDPMSRYFRSPELPLEAGRRVALDGFEVEVIAVNADGDPAVLLYRFDRALEDRALRWIRWDRDRYVAWSPPAVGGSVRLPPGRLFS